MADILNAAQQQAVDFGDGPLVIIAGPGTGKTKTLTARIRRLVAGGVAPKKILALTFTKKAAGEMKDRLSDLVPKPTISTFHSLCFSLLTEKLGKVPGFVSEPARLAIIKTISKPLAFKGMSTRELGLLISRAKNMDDQNVEITTLTERYNYQLRAQQLYDFDDLLLQTRDLLQADSEWRSAVQQRFSHILVDEFQDTNALQYQLLQLIRATDNLCLIGDPQQSIYGFRGADGDIFARFNRDNPNATNITLSTNYRSAQAIVQTANAVYPDMPALRARSDSAGVARTVQVLNEYSEAQWVLNEIQKAIGGSDFLNAVSNDRTQGQRSFGEFAVLYRNRSAARAVRAAFETSGVPFQVVGDGSPYDQPDIQTIIGILAKAADQSRNPDIKGFSTAQLDVFISLLGATDPPHKIAHEIITKLDMSLTAEARQLLSVLYGFESAVQATAYFDELSSQQFYDPRADAVTLLTIHAAKGLEFPHVFVIAAEENILPSARGDLTEEQRLFYVALTRAKERMDIVHACTRGGQSASVSRFIRAIPPDTLPRVTDPALSGDERRVKKRQAKRAQTSLF